MEIEEKIGAEALPEEHRQEHTPAEPPGDAVPELPGDTPAEPHAASRTPPPGRRWVKGQSGNPRGRPSRAHKAAYVAQAMFDRKTVQLVERTIGWGQGSDKSMLRLYVQKMVPPRQEVPVWLNLPPIENRADLRATMKAVATGVAQGDITSAQGLRLVRMFGEIYGYL
jgi:hypothetical protein